MKEVKCYTRRYPLKKKGFSKGGIEEQINNETYGTKKKELRYKSNNIKRDIKYEWIKQSKQNAEVVRLVKKKEE